MHFLHHKVQIMDGGKLHNNKLFGFKEVVKVGTAEALAGTTLALRADGAEVGFVFALCEVNLARARQGNAVAGKFCGVGAIKGV